MATRRRTWWWLVAAVLLLAGAAWLMLSGDPPIAPTPDEVQLPRRMRSAERQRAEQRRTLAVAPTPFDGGVVSHSRPRDPVLALMPAEVKHVAMVAEFNAIVNSDVGGLMMECLFSGDDSRLLNRLRDAGLDPGTSIDRVAIIDDSVVITGGFKGEPWRRLTDRTPVVKDYGRSGKLYEWVTSDGGVETTASWGDQMLLAGGSEESLKRSLDRLDSPTHDKRVLDEDQAYGEVYGLINANTIADVIGEQDKQLAETFRSAADAVHLHADVSHDVGLVADIDGSNAERTEQLRRSLGGALSLGRMQAQAKGQVDVAQLLDSASVAAAGDGSFRLQAGLPYEYMKKVFQACVDRKHRAPRTEPQPEL